MLDVTPYAKLFNKWYIWLYMMNFQSYPFYFLNSQQCLAQSTNRSSLTFSKKLQSLILNVKQTQQDTD